MMVPGLPGKTPNTIHPDKKKKSTAPATVCWYDMSALLFNIVPGTLLHIHVNNVYYDTTLHYLIYFVHGNVLASPVLNPFFFVFLSWWFLAIFSLFILMYAWLYAWHHGTQQQSTWPCPSEARNISSGSFWYFSGSLFHRKRGPILDDRCSQLLQLRCDRFCYFGF